MRPVSRRGFLGLAAGTGLLVALPGCASLRGVVQTGELLRSQAELPRPFRVPLPVPQVAKPSRRAADADFYDITAREADVEILPGLRTRIFGYGGTFPGPTIVSRRDRRTVVRHVNELPVPMVVHLHGGHTPPASDGYPVDLVLPRGQREDVWSHEDVGNVARGSRQYAYPMRQRAATLWYHDHRMDFTGPQVYRGLAGFHLVHDEEEDALPLPAGERDIPLMIADRAFTEDGEFAYPSVDPTLSVTPGVEGEYHSGVLGDVIVVNGAPWPVLEVSAARYRFRILNASNARRLRLALDPVPTTGSSFVQIGSDGGLLESPVGHDQLVVASAERFDVVIDFGAYPVGTEITMVNELGEDEPTSSVMRFRVVRAEDDNTHVPDRLSSIERIDPDAAVRTREFRFERTALDGHGMGWGINGKGFHPGKPEAEPKLGDIEIWRFVSDLHHPVHVHLDPFQVVSRRGGPPGRYDSGWKDTVDVTPTEYVDVAVRFSTYTGMYVMHCHNLEHEDMMMMAAFRTVDE